MRELVFCLYAIPILFKRILIRFIYHVREARDLRETRICTINTTLEKNQSSINQHRIHITIQ